MLSNTQKKEKIYTLKLQLLIVSAFGGKRKKEKSNQDSGLKRDNLLHFISDTQQIIKGAVIGALYARTFGVCCCI